MDDFPKRLLSEIPQWEGLNRSLQIRIEPGMGRLVLCLGDNCTGKSLLRKAIQQFCRKNGIQTIHLSMQDRAGSGAQFGGLKSFVYGSEEDESTGVCSIGTILGMMRTSRGRSEPHMVILDEPDLGLSDRWARSLGNRMVEFIQTAPSPLVAMMVITHRPSLVQGMRHLNPHGILVGPDWPQSIADWISGDPRDLEPIEDLQERGIAKWREINRLLQNHGKSGGKEP